MTGVHAANADIHLIFNAAAQVMAAAGENINESRKKDNDDGEDAHECAVQSGLDYTLREHLQGGREEPEAAVHGRDKHDSREDKETSDEEADHQV